MRDRGYYKHVALKKLILQPTVLQYVRTVAIRGIKSFEWVCFFHDSAHHWWVRAPLELGAGIPHTQLHNQRAAVEHPWPAAPEHEG